jgi:hypothetical protein
MNNILSINWKLISRSIPKGRHASNDRPPSREEVIKILEYTDRSQGIKGPVENNTHFFMIFKNYQPLRTRYS